jgi:type II secretory pathway pseudopilin PulG
LLELVDSRSGEGQNPAVSDFSRVGQFSDIFPAGETMKRTVIVAVLTLSVGLVASLDSTVNAESPSPPDEQQNRAEAKTGNWPPISDAVYPAWVLVIVGIVGAWIAIRTLTNIDRQTKAAEVSAEAARLNAQALIDAERAWIFVTISPLPGLPEESDRVEALFVMPTIKDYGRTPARIKKIWAKKQQFTNPVPPEPDYEIADSVELDEIVLPPQVAIQPLRLSFSGSDFKQAREDSNLSLCIYGYVDYSDLANRPRQTRFCYIYQVQAGFNPLPSGFYIGGPSAYNKAT